MKPVTSAGLTISLSLLPYPERSETVGKGILKGNWPGGLETPTAAENSTVPRRATSPIRTGPRRPSAALWRTPAVPGSVFEPHNSPIAVGPAFEHIDSDS